MGVVPRVLVVDDDARNRELAATALRDAGFEVRCLEDPLRVVEVLASDRCELVLTGLEMSVMRGTDVCRAVRNVAPNVPVIVAMSGGSVRAVVEAMKAGAFDCVSKPIEADVIALVARRAAEQHALRVELMSLRELVDPSHRAGKIIGTSPAIREIHDLIERIKDSNAAVLITGESGTGKELVAREIHERGARRDEPFVAVNCAAIPEALLESELFGHVKGAFTDARRDRPGLFVAATGGTLLLDEIGDMPLALQSKLLRVLQEHAVRPVGGTREVPIDVRIIAATNRDPEHAMELGSLREDLYYRLNVIHVDLPPLRARGGDVLHLAQHFLKSIARHSGACATGFTAEAAEKLLSYHWPGNVRELQNCVERAVALARGVLIEASDLPRKVKDYKSSHLLVAADDPSELATLEEVERRYITRVIETCGRNKSHAARVLGISRKTLYRRLESFRPDVAPRGRLTDDELEPFDFTQPSTNQFKVAPA